MRRYVLCPICAEDQLGVPLVEDKGFQVCPLCQSAFPIKNKVGIPN